MSRILGKYLSSMLDEHKIYWDGEEISIREACEKITDEEIDNGQVCNQTVVDLMKVMRTLYAIPG